jgi:hypothetical protein
MLGFGRLEKEMECLEQRVDRLDGVVDSHVSVSGGRSMGKLLMQLRRLCERAEEIYGSAIELSEYYLQA